MKHLLISLSVLAAVSVASAKNFTSAGSSKRNPAQTGNIGPAGAPPSAPATIECKFVVNGSNGPSQVAQIKTAGSEATEDYEVEGKPVLGGGSDIQANISMRQVFGTTYASTLWLTDAVTGVQTLSQDFIEFPATMQSTSAAAMLLFSKDVRQITMNGKKMPMNNVQLICILSRKITM